MYFEYFTDGCILQNPIPAVIIKIFGKWLENVLERIYPYLNISILKYYIEVGYGTLIINDMTYLKLLNVISE